MMDYQPNRRGVMNAISGDKFNKGEWKLQDKNYAIIKTSLLIAYTNSKRGIQHSSHTQKKTMPQEMNGKGYQLVKKVCYHQE